jgi:SAM-dependent methyltransferase
VASAYDQLGPVYDTWCRSVTEDIPFYVEAGVQAGGRVLELGVGSGRIAVPLALAGVDVVGVDLSPVMLDLARARARPHGLDLVLVEGDMRRPPPLGRFALVIIPFRALLHLPDDRERLTVLRAARRLLVPGGTLAFDVFHPDRADIEDTHERWIERERGIDERAVWNRDERALELTVRSRGVSAAMRLWWADPHDWRRLLEEAGFVDIEAYGGFDRRPLRSGDTDSVWVAHRAAERAAG